LPQLTQADAVDCAHAAANIAADLAANRRTDLPHSSAFYRGICAGLLMAVEGITVAEASEQTARLVRSAMKRAGHAKG
jgi:hypothetical protein